MSYGPDLGENYRRTAALADRVLKGARPCSTPRHGHPKALRGETKIFYGPPPHVFIFVPQALQIAVTMP
jgi:hypothetical protein